MTNDEIRQHFIERFREADATPRGKVKISFDTYRRLHEWEASELRAGPRWALARDIRRLRNEVLTRQEPCPRVVNDDHGALAEDYRNRLLYGEEIARELRYAK